MTVLGKILVIVNLVLSVAVGAFIVMTFVARTNWHLAYKEQETQRKAAEQTSETLKNLVLQANQDLAKAQADAATALKSEQEKGAAALLQRDDLKGKLTAEQIKVKERDTLLESQKQQVDLRQKEVDYLKGLVASRDDKIKTMEADVENSHNHAVDMEIARNAEHERNNRLLAENERLVKEIQKGAAAGVAGANGQRQNRPPAEDVEGLVTKTDASGLLTISIGSDAGLAKGNTLEVYRLSPEAKYLGTIEIIAVQSDQAVARPVSRPNGVIKVGDRVSSRILTRR